jgi:hypothetical protein
MADFVAFAGAFDFDHARAEIGEHARAVRTREHAGEIDNGNTGEQGLVRGGRCSHDPKLAMIAYSILARTAYTLFLRQNSLSRLEVIARNPLQNEFCNRKRGRDPQILNPRKARESRALVVLRVLCAAAWKRIYFFVSTICNGPVSGGGVRRGRGCGGTNRGSATGSASFTLLGSVWIITSPLSCSAFSTLTLGADGGVVADRADMGAGAGSAWTAGSGTNASAAAATGAGSSAITA